MSKEALTPVEQRIIVFYEDELTAVVVDMNGRQVVYVPIRPICDFLGVAWSPQRRRINRDPILSEAMTSVTVTVTESGQRGQMLCLPIDYLNGWLFGINADRVKVEIRENVLRYQRECYRVLADAFIARSTDTAVSPAEKTLLQVEQMGLAIALATPEKNFARIYGELYRRFGITSYKLLPAKQFAEAMQFLTDWFVRLTGDEELKKKL